MAIFPGVTAAAVFVGIVAWTMRMFIDNRFKMRSLPFDVPVIIFMMLGAISVFMSPARSFTLIYNYCGLVGIYGLTYILVGQNIRTLEQAKSLMKVTALSALVVVLCGYFQYIFGVDIADMKWVDGEAFPELRKRVFSTLENPNVLAGYLDVMICLALGMLAKIDNRQQKITLIVAIIMLAACLAMTYSRGAFLSIAIVFVIYGILQDWRILILFAGMTGLIILNDATFFERILSVFTSTIDSSEGLRVGIWVSTIAMIADHPFIGIGWGAYKFIYPQYNYYLADPSIIIYHAHNLYLNVAAEVGIVGALAYFWYFFGTMFSSLALSANSRYMKIRDSAQSAFETQIRTRVMNLLVQMFMTSDFLQKLAQSKAMFMTRMADLSDKVLDWFSFTPSESELRESGKKDADISDEDIGVESKLPKPVKKREPELVHHDELKWSSPPLGKNITVEKFVEDNKDEIKTLAEKIFDSDSDTAVTKTKPDDKKSDDDKMDLQRFAADDIDKEQSAVKIAEGLRLGIGLAFLSMALNGMSDDLLFNIPSSILMWQLGALSAAVKQLETSN